MKKIYFILVSLFCITCLSAQDSIQFLVADYPFSYNADDVSGNNNNGIVFGATLTTDRFGNENSAYYFDGVDDYIEIIPEGDVSNIGDFTLCVWAYLENWDEQYGIDSQHLDRQYIFDGHSYSSVVNNDFFREGFYMAYNLDYENSEYLMTGFWENYSSYPKYMNVSVLQNWHFLVYTREDNLLKQYFDGELIKTDSIINNTLDMQHNWFIGTFSGNNPNYNDFNYNFHGKIDDIKIFQCALTDEEVNDLYSNTQDIDKNNYSIQLYPNPTTEFLVIETETDIISEIQIYDISGKLVLSNVINSNHKEIDVSKLPQSVYLINIKINNTVFSKKFIKYTH